MGLPLSQHLFETTDGACFLFGSVLQHSHQVAVVEVSCFLVTVVHPSKCASLHIQPLYLELLGATLAGAEIFQAVEVESLGALAQR